MKVNCKNVLPWQIRNTEKDWLVLTFPCTKFKRQLLNFTAEILRINDVAKHYFSMKNKDEMPIFCKIKKFLYNLLSTKTHITSYSDDNPLSSKRTNFSVLIPHVNIPIITLGMPAILTWKTRKT